MLQDIVVDIVSESGTHIYKEITHLFPCHIRKQMDIVITRDGFQTLSNVIIIDSAHIDLV
jgi:hypothetical protein